MRKNLTLFEEEMFPGETLQKPRHIQLPATARPLHAVTELDWIIHRVHIATGFRGFTALKTWLWAHYDMELHLDTFRQLEDSYAVWPSCAAWSYVRPRHLQAPPGRGMAPFVVTKIEMRVKAMDMQSVAGWKLDCSCRCCKKPMDQRTMARKALSLKCRIQTSPSVVEKKNALR